MLATVSPSPRAALTAHRHARRPASVPLFRGLVRQRPSSSRAPARRKSGANPPVPRSSFAPDASVSNPAPARQAPTLQIFFRGGDRGVMRNLRGRTTRATPDSQSVPWHVGHEPHGAHTRATLPLVVAGERVHSSVRPAQWLQFRRSAGACRRDGNFRSGAECEMGRPATEWWGDGEPRAVGPLATASVADGARADGEGFGEALVGWDGAVGVGVAGGGASKRRPATASATSHLSVRPRRNDAAGPRRDR